MRGSGKIVEGILYLDPELHKYVQDNNESDCDVEIHVINKPEHYLYRYLFGFLIRDIAEHSGESVDDIHHMMKERFATEFVSTWDEVPRRHRAKCQRFERIRNVDGNEYVERWYTKSCSAMTHEELSAYVKNVENHFFDFMEGAISGNKARQLEAHELRTMGMMSKDELKKYKKNKTVEIRQEERDD